MLRKAAVAGYFYPASRNAIESQIAGFISGTVQPAPAMGAVLPHAGYKYSGHVAVQVYERIKIADSVILIGPNHGAGRNITPPPPAAIMSEGVWELPGGNVAIDEALAVSLKDETGVLEEAAWTHEAEHSLEVQIPLLQYFKESFKIIPIIIWNLPDKKIMELASALTRGIVKYGKPVTMIASTDFSHYIPHETARRLDAMAIEKIMALDGPGLLKVVRDNKITMCGYQPTALVIETLKLLGATKAELVEYKTSGDTSGDYTSVVGYGGLIIS
ncbi:MAG: AmmeMemoRadiSam system protein B [Nitrospinae bacterium]|nr:AmmeMemoRadiSam system protein B [Nitrospinota bacterium]